MHRSVVIAATLAVLLTGVLVVLQPDGSGRPGHPAVRDAQHPRARASVPRHGWIIQDHALKQLAGDDRTRRALEGHAVFDIVGKARPTRIRTAIRTVKFESFRTFRLAVKNAQLPHTVEAVIYDPEAWSFTPLREQRRVGHYLRRFVVLARRQGLIAVVAPSIDLAKVVDPRGSGPYWKRHLRRSLAAVPADVVVIQAQSLEARPGAYARFVRSAAAQARRAGATRVFAGLSTGPTGSVVTSLDLFLASRAVSSFVDGFWLNAPAGPSARCPRCTGGPVRMLNSLIRVRGGRWR